MSKEWNNIYGILQKSNNKYAYYLGNYSYVDPSKGKMASRFPRQHVGWGKRAIKMRANKTHFDCFENDALNLNATIRKYRINDAFEKIKEDVLVCGVGFLALANDRVMPFTAQEATGTYDWYRQNLKNGIAVFQKNTTPDSSKLAPRSWMEFDDHSTTVYDGDAVTTSINITGRPFMGILTHNSTTKRPFGRSVLTRPARDAIVDASRAVRQAMIAAHHYNTKVDVLLGVDTSTAVDKIEAQTGDILKVGANENGQIPQIGEFAQHAMAPFNETILAAARNFCADTDLSLANLGITSDAPQSTEALEIASDDLRDDILEWQRELGEQLKYFAVTLWMKDNQVRKIDDSLQSKIESTKPIWLPVYRSDVSKFGDGLNKIAQVAPEAIKARSIWRNLGLTSAEVDTVISSIEKQ